MPKTFFVVWSLFAVLVTTGFAWRGKLGQRPLDLMTSCWRGRLWRAYRAQIRHVSRPGMALGSLSEKLLANGKGRGRLWYRLAAMTEVVCLAVEREACGS